MENQLLNKDWIGRVRKERPLIHCMTNYVTAGYVADMLLAAGGSPVMAAEIKEVEEVVSLSRALCINLGTIEEGRLPAIELAGRRAGKLQKLTLLDPVGAGSSVFRTEAARGLLMSIPFHIVRGNYSEIRALVTGEKADGGVDVSERDKREGGCGKGREFEEGVSFVKKAAVKLNAVVAMTGAVDFISDGNVAYAVLNGHPWMTKLTGTGCMLDAVICAFAGVHRESLPEAAAAALSLYGFCGELAYEMAGEIGLGSYRAALLDAMSKMNGEVWKGGARIEIC